jgi:hypothetical protein
MAHKQLDKLLVFLEAIAKSNLEKNGEFYPIAASIDQNDKGILNASYDGDEYSKSDDLIVLLKAGFAQDIKEKKIRALAICSDVSLTRDGKKEDALRFSLEHESGESLNVYIPYTKSSSNKIEYGEIFAEVKEREFFL